MGYYILKAGMKKLIPRFINLLRQLPPPSRFAIWLCIAFAIKALFFTLKLAQYENPVTFYPTFILNGWDSKSYIDPIENLINNGAYVDDYRMPGYGWLYYLLRLFLTQSNALNLLGVIQLILSAISVYVLALLAQRISKRQSLFYLVFFLYLISTFVSIFDVYLLTESFSTSALIFSTWFLLDFEKGNKRLLYAGLFLTWVVFLKPVMAPLFLFFGIYVLFKNRNFTRKITNYNWKYLFIFILPFIVLDGAWTMRNYNKYKSFYPLTKSMYYTEIEESYLAALFRFMNAFGGSIVFWEPQSEITFLKPLSPLIQSKGSVRLPDYIYTSRFTEDSLLVLRKYIQQVESDSILEEQRAKLNYRLISKLNSYTLSIQQEKPFLYYVSSRFRVLKTFFVHSGTYNLFNKSSVQLTHFEFVIKIAYSLLYVFVVLFGFGGIFYCFIRERRNREFLFIAVMGLYLAIIFPLGLKLDESRYFVSAYPFFLLLATFMALKSVDFIRQKAKI